VGGGGGEHAVTGVLGVGNARSGLQLRAGVSDCARADCARTKSSANMLQPARPRGSVVLQEISE